MQKTRELEVAQEAARAGGAIALRAFREGVTIRSKESYNLVSDADLQSEQKIVEIIGEAFPEHAVLGEESHSGDASAEHLWIIDPIDGTNNFAHGIGHFAISIAYYRQGSPMCGVVFNPVREDWYLATAGGGAWYNGEQIHVNESIKLTEVLVGVGFFYDRGAKMEATLAAIGDLFREKIHGIRRFGTASLDLVQVACGMFGAFFEYELAPWDYAAGRLIVEEAGGRVTTCTGEVPPIAKTSLLVSNGHLHAAMMEIIRRHLPE